MISPRCSARRAADTTETAHRRTGTDNVIDSDNHPVRDVESSGRAAVSVCRQTAAARAGSPRRTGAVVDSVAR